MTIDPVPPRRWTRALAHTTAVLLAVTLAGPAAPPGVPAAVDSAPDTPAPRTVHLLHPAPPAGVPARSVPGPGVAADSPPNVPPEIPPTVPLDIPPSQHAFEPPWSWPLKPQPRVSRYFLPPPEPWKAGHRGVDLAAGTAAEVLSPADGIVTFVGMVAGRPVLSIGHDGGLLSSFEPVRSALPKGSRVQRGQAVGHIAAPPHCPFPCIHWGVRLNGAYVNPLAYVTDRRPSVLLPLRDG